MIFLVPCSYPNAVKTHLIVLLMSFITLQFILQIWCSNFILTNYCQYDITEQSSTKHQQHKTILLLLLFLWVYYGFWQSGLGLANFIFPDLAQLSLTGFIHACLIKLLGWQQATYLWWLTLLYTSSLRANKKIWQGCWTQSQPLKLIFFLWISNKLVSALAAS